MINHCAFLCDLDPFGCSIRLFMEDERERENTHDHLLVQRSDAFRVRQIALVHRDDLVVEWLC